MPRLKIRRRSLLDKLIETKPNIGVKTINSYMDKLHILREFKQKKEGKPISERGELTEKDLKIIADQDLVEELLESKKESTAKNYYIAYSVLLQIDFEEYEPEIEFYSKMAKEIQEKYEKFVNEQMKTPYQTANWSSIKDLQKVLDEQFKAIQKLNLESKDTISKSEFKQVQLWFIGSLYIADPEGHPPVRADYAPMDIITYDTYKQILKGDNEENKLLNFLVISLKYKDKPLHFYFGSHKTSKTYGPLQIDISKKMKPIISFFLMVHRKFTHQRFGSLLLNRMFKPMNENGLSKNVPTVFKSTGKNITITLLRHIVISDVVPARKSKEQDIAKKMMHSPSTQGDYSKKTED